VRPGDRVAFIGASGPEFAEVMYGAVNNRLSVREVLAILADAEPRVVVADPPAATCCPSSWPTSRACCACWWTAR
jgi:hypothetical protein